jgi:sn-glycerol 3-phosphate transport system ATP-binding protein
MLEIEHLLERRRASFRVASASASPWGAPSCASPKVFLFDEPLSNLDAKLRGQMRVEIKKLQRRSASPRSMSPMTSSRR